MQLTESDMKNEAQRLLSDAPRVGSYWRHYKGGEYRVVATCIKEDTHEPLVVYRSLAHGTVWARTLSNWRETVDVNGQNVPRFSEMAEGRPTII